MPSREDLREQRDLVFYQGIKKWVWITTSDPCPSHMNRDIRVRIDQYRKGSDGKD